MRSNRRELAVLRGKRDPESLGLWAASFGKGDEEKARRYALAIATFLGQPTDGGAGWQDYIGQLSPNTRVAYAYAITEFFEWAAAVHRRVVAPEDVTRKDAEDYVNWLANRPFSLGAEKLRDGDQPEQLMLYEIVEKAGSINLRGIAKELSPTWQSKLGNMENRANRQVLSRKVRELISSDVLEATPTLCALRKQYPQAGITLFELPMGERGRLMNLEDVFQYQVKQQTKSSRTTIAQRLAALSAFWQVMMEGENVSGGEALLQYNIWQTVKKRVTRGLSHQKKEAARKQKVPSEAVIQMLRDAPGKTLIDLRNRALLYLLIFSGIRVSELVILRSGRPSDNWPAWFDGSEPPALQLVRKGNKQQRIPYPPVALAKLIEFQSELQRRAAQGFNQHTDPEGEHYIVRTSVAWYYRDLTLPDAPLFPPLALWGKNQRRDYRKPMSRQAVFSILDKMAATVGLTGETCRQIHPHALRHFSANAMAEGGKDLREIQSIFGHSSITTTEGYLEDVEGDVRLSGQQEVLSYLQARGEEVEPVHVGEAPREREVIDVVGVEEIADETPAVSPEEVEVIQALAESIPAHTLPEAPPEYDPEATAILTPEGETVIAEDEKLVGLDGGVPAEEILEDLASTVVAGQSPGSPTWVYEAMREPKGPHETVVFNRGGERDKDWLFSNYPKMPPNCGVGQESFLPWYVKARGAVSRGGYHKGMPPFPVFAPEQVNPETDVGEAFIAQVEQQYSEFVHGNPEKGTLPSPMRSVGMVRWYSFFVYHAQRIEDHFNAQFKTTIPTWEPFETVVMRGNFRAHDTTWLLRWLADNAHTYRASVDAMKRGVERGKADVTDSFLKSSFEGIELLTDVPEWMIEDDPVHALWESDPKQWREMVEWLKNVTGQKLEPRREIDRDEQEEFASEEAKARARNIRNILLEMMRFVDRLERAKKTQKEKVKEHRDEVRTSLVQYALTASGKERLGKTLQQLLDMSTREFNREMSQFYKEEGVPDPNSREYRKFRGKARVSAIIAALFPDIPELVDPNIFAESALFNPRWFRIDEKNKTIQIEEEERDKLIQQFGQDPELLVRRATRAMWEAREKDYEALWGVMMSYFSWIVPSGREMESQVRGIPVVDLGSEDFNVQARRNWLKAWTRRMKDLASGKVQPGESSKVETDWERILREEGLGVRGQDALDHVAEEAVDFASSASIDEYSPETPEALLIGMQEEMSDELWPNKFCRRMLPNGRGTYVHLEGERPQGWYRVDLYGRRKGHYRPNAPPQLMSPGAVYQSQKRVFGARQLLPSPFRMVSAMGLLSD